MSEQIIIILKRKLDDLAAYGGIDAETRVNALKEELQYYVLNFIYHHSEYGRWTMYGGSALRICFDLDRMSVDLDFEVEREIKNDFLGELKREIGKHFSNTYNIEPDFLTIKINNERGLTLKFHVGKELAAGYASAWVHIKIDLNYFPMPKKIVTERRPINHGQLSFVIKTYNLSALMASKIAAIFLRGTRGVGKTAYEEKGRDIYDLLWYMNKKAVPDFDYLMVKGIDAKDPHALFDKLTLQMNKVSDKNLEQDLKPLFMNKAFIGDWLKNWRESYLRLLDDYKIRTVAGLQKIIVNEDFGTDNFSFTYIYDTAEKESVSVTYTVTYEWIMHVDLNGEIREDVLGSTDFGSRKESEIKLLKQYATLFWQKTRKYFEKTNGVMLGDSIVTKIIKTTADNLNQKEQVMLNKSALLSCELDDLLK